MAPNMLENSSKVVTITTVRCSNTSSYGS